MTHRQVLLCQFAGGIVGVVVKNILQFLFCLAYAVKIKVVGGAVDVCQQEVGV